MNVENFKIEINLLQIIKSLDEKSFYEEILNFKTENKHKKLKEYLIKQHSITIELLEKSNKNYLKKTLKLLKLLYSNIYQYNNKSVFLMKLQKILSLDKSETKGFINEFLNAWISKTKKSVILSLDIVEIHLSKYSKILLKLIHQYYRIKITDINIFDSNGKHKSSISMKNEMNDIIKSYKKDYICNDTYNQNYSEIDYNFSLKIEIFSTNTNFYKLNLSKKKSKEQKIISINETISFSMIYILFEELKYYEIHKENEISSNSSNCDYKDICSILDFINKYNKNENLLKLEDYTELDNLKNSFDRIFNRLNVLLFTNSNLKEKLLGLVLKYLIEFESDGKNTNYDYNNFVNYNYNVSENDSQYDKVKDKKNEVKITKEMELKENINKVEIKNNYKNSSSSLSSEYSKLKHDSFNN